MRRSRQESARWGLRLWFIEVFCVCEKKISRKFARELDTCNATSIIFRGTLKDVKVE